MPDQISKAQHAVLRDVAQREQRRAGGFELAGVSSVADDGTVTLDQSRDAGAGGVGSLGEASEAGKDETSVTVRQNGMRIRLGKAPFYRGQP